MPRMIFVNLPVTDLARSTRFYEAIGCVRNEVFSTEQVSAMVWSEAITFQLLTHDFFATFSPRPIADAHKAAAALYALSCDSRDAVDAMVEAASVAGGAADVSAPRDMGFMYFRSFEDPDGNVIEPVWMDMSAVSGNAG